MSAWVDAADILSTPPVQIDWLVKLILPAGTCGDFFGPPGSGKSTIILSLALAVAGGQKTWFGREIQSGPVALIGGEKSSKEVWGRDLHRLTSSSKIEKWRMMIDLSDEPLWAWDRKEGVWVETEAGKKMKQDLIQIGPILTVIDTLTRAADGQNVIDIAQQAALARAIEKFGKEIGGTLLTVSHSNQASQKESLAWRLNYMSRCGGNGLPGIFRWIGGVTVLGQDEIGDECQNRRIIAFAVSKDNEMPQGFWNIFSPAFFELNFEGRLLQVTRAEVQGLMSKNKKKKKKSKLADEYEYADKDEEIYEEVIKDADDWGV